MAARDRIIEVIYRLKDLFSRDSRRITASFQRVGDQSDTTTAQIERNNNRISASFGLLRRGLQGVGAAVAGRFFVQANRDLETLRKGLELITGDSQSAEQEIRFLRETTTQLGLPAREAGRAYLNLAAAAKNTSLEGQATRDIFVAVGNAMARLGATTDDTSGVLRALQQIISKGTVQSEELRGQLGERLPGAFQAASRALGLTTEELGKFLKQGAITAEDLLPALTEELNEVFGGGTGEQIETITAGFNRFQNSLKAAAQAINDTTGATTGLGRALGFIGSVISTLSVSFTTVSESFQALGRNLGSFVAFVTQDFSVTGYRRFLQDVAENNRIAEIAIADAAEAVFSQDANLRIATEALKDHADQTKRSSDETETFKDRIERQNRESENLKRTYDNLENANNNLETSIKQAARGFREASNELIEARKEADETVKEFDELFDSLTAPPEQEVGILDIFDAISRAQEQLRDADPGAALETLRQAGENLTTLKETGDVADITIKDLATSLRELAGQAAEAQTEDEIITAEQSKKDLDELLNKKRELVEGPIQFKTEIDTTALDEFTPEEVVVPVRFEIVGGVPALTDGTDVTAREATKRGFRP